MRHLGDITIIHDPPRAEVVIGGSPCQDLSVAGKRAGIAGKRSGLFMEQIRIIKEMRENDIHAGRAGADVFPRYMVWENVPGALSSNKGEDFRTVLEETIRVVDKNAAIPRYERWSWRTAGVIMGDGWSVAWRIHDAQFWGVPQRRRRIALVADFGGEYAPEILFERNGVPGDSEPRGKAGEGFAPDAPGRADETGEPDLAVMSFSQNGSGETTVHKNCNTITANQNPSGRGTAMIYGFQPQAGGNTGCAIGEDRAQCLGVTQKPAVYDARGNGKENKINGTLQAKSTGGSSVNLQNICREGSMVRRLTPLECERLQGYPDGWTDIGDWIDSKGKKHKAADSPRYKALGNSIALPFWDWMLRRLNGYCQEHTMASLFDGIGGFPLIWERLNGPGSCLWASEIEEFAIAVTKYHFGDGDID